MKKQKKTAKKNVLRETSLAVPDQNQKKKYEEQNRTAQHKKAMLEALKQTLGIVTTACEQCGIGRSQYYAWLREDKEFAKEVKDISEIAIDYAESLLLRSMKRAGPGAVTAQIFYLKTKGRNRGYVERQEVTGKDGDAIEVNVQKKMSREDLMREAAARGLPTQIFK